MLTIIQASIGVFVSVLSGLSLAQLATPAAEQPCSIKETLGHREVEVKWKHCPEDDSDNHKDESFYIPEDVPKIRYPEVYFRRFNVCRPGLETILNCDSNPDIRECEDGSFPYIRQIYRKEDDQLIQTEPVCPEDPLPSLPPDVEIIEVINVTPEQFRTFPILGSQIHSNPNLFSLKNGYTHFWASSRPQLFDVNIGSSVVAIRATPVQWHWDYGDGNARSLNSPGTELMEHTLHEETPTSHVYSDTGTFQVSLTTLFRGEFSVDGGAWQPIPGQAAVPSEPIEIDVWRTEKELIANE